MRPLSFHHVGEVVLPQIKGFISYREPNAVFFCSWRQGGAGACRTGPGDGDISTQRLMGCPGLPWACWLFVGVLGSEPGMPLLLRTVGSFNPLRPRVFSNPLFPSLGAWLHLWRLVRQDGRPIGGRTSESRGPLGGAGHSR